MYEIGNLVTLNHAEQYDKVTHISTEEIGEIVDIANPDDRGTRYVVAMQEMVDEEGVTPLLWRHANELNLYQI